MRKCENCIYSKAFKRLFGQVIKVSCSIFSKGKHKESFIRCKDDCPMYHPVNQPYPITISIGKK